jgi:phosphatidylserine synthase
MKVTSYLGGIRMNQQNQKTLGGLFVGLTALLAAAVYLLLGFTVGGWHIYWVVFLAIPIMSIIVDIIEGHKPLSARIPGIVALACVIAFILIGFLAGIWHPTWLIFFAVPISGVIVKMFTKDSDTPPQDQQ